MSINAAADALRQQYTQAGTLGQGMIESVGTGYTPPPAGNKFAVIDLNIASGYPAPAESSSGYDFSGTHYRVRSFALAANGTRSYQSLSS